MHAQLFALTVIVIAVADFGLVGTSIAATGAVLALVVDMGDRVQRNRAEFDARMKRATEE